MIPESVINSLLDLLNPGENDSNEDYIYYLTRDQNNADHATGGRNKINTALAGFNEHLHFTKTSDFNNSFIQMFECADDDGKATFTKLAIRDLGVIRRRPNDSGAPSSLRMKNNIVGKLSDAEVDSSATDENYEFSELAHVFAFGKLISSDKNPAVPGSEIYFFPLFVLECIIER
jgi:hypothetical protein